MDSPMKLFRFPGGRQFWNAPGAAFESRFIYNEIFVDRCYEQHGVTARDGDIVFDVGANVGMFAVSLMERLRGLRIWCFEPVPATFQCLSRNIAECAARERQEVTLLNMGLGAAEGEITIEYFPDAPGNSTQLVGRKRDEFRDLFGEMRFADMWRQDKARTLLFAPFWPFRRRFFQRMIDAMFAKGVQVACPVRTLGAIVREQRLDRIDLLKIDVEGAEFDVLAGLGDADWGLVKQIVMEVAPANKHRLEPLIERLRRLGFENIVVEGMFGRPADMTDAFPCNVYAVRGGRL